MNTSALKKDWNVSTQVTKPENGKRVRVRRKRSRKYPRYIWEEKKHNEVEKLTKASATK